MNKPVKFSVSDKPRIPTAEELGFDPAELRRKYAFERDRRLRSDGAKQYIDIEDDLKHFSDDTYIGEEIVREPQTAEIEVAILGAGFGGMLMAARLQEAGIRDFRIIERAGDFGGTWYWNRYPGAQCDIESYVYLPLLEETGYMPKEKYSYGPEIYEHAQRVGRYFDLYPRSLFQTQVRELRWDEAASRWHVTTDRGDHFRAHHVIISSGSLNRPKLPGLPGIRDFKGHTFHTSRWDYAYTGGSPTDGDLTRLADKRVAIIGTGATAIQCIPFLGKSARHLYVFQRTPSSVDERRNRPTDPAWFRSLPKGWQSQRTYNFACLLAGTPVEQDLVSDGWTELFKALNELVHDSHGDLSAEELAQLGEIVDFQQGNRVRARVDSIVKNPKTAEALKAWYRPWCKRPTFHDEYLPTFNLPNVTLVDTGGKGVSKVTANGLVVGGVEYPVDCLIFATGFEVSRATYTHQADLEIHGRDGVKLGDYWKNGMRTHHGLQSYGFPNLFHMGFTQTASSPNFTDSLNQQAQHIAAVLREAQARGYKAFEPTRQAEADWVDLVNTPGPMTEYLAACTPGYYNAEGTAKGSEGFLQGQYPGGGIKFYELLDAWRAKGDFAGLSVR